jgi:ABC-type Mn2+/Zn2+ transport system ATPase subunit
MTWWFITIIVIDNIFLTLIESYFMIRISDGDYHLVKYFLAFRLISPIINNLCVRPMISRLARRVSHQFDKINIKKYDLMSFESKNNKPSTLFWEKNNAASRAITTMIDWGMPNAIGLIGTLCGVFYTFIKKNMVPELIIILIICGMFYRIFIRSKQNAYTILDKELKKVIQKIRSKIQLDLIPFQYKEYEPNHIISQCKTSNKNCVSLNIAWLEISSYINISNKFISVVISYFASNDIPSFMLILLTMNELSCTITNISYFITQYNGINNDYINLDDFWDKAEFNIEPKKMYPSDNLLVNHVYIKREKTSFKVQLAPNCHGISLAPGEKIYIHGSTGGGKSTLVKAILGQLKGAHMNIGNPENYYHCVADYFQEIKEKIPSSNISIRDYFKGETNDLVIEKYLLRVFKPDELTRIKETLMTNESQDSLTPKNPYDMEINEKISGGQKSRLILTLRGYEIDLKNKGIIVLDEPCPDVDHDTYTEVMNTFFNCYHRCTIIMIGHLCACKKASLKINWTQEYTVNNGLVSRD